MKKHILILCSSTLILSQNIRSTHAVENVLDNLHLYAAEAKSKAYMALFSKDAIFFGTDISERWPKDEFDTYATKRMATGTGWTYVMNERNVFFSDGGEEGFNWSVGLMTGTMTVKNEFQNGDVTDDGNDEYSGWGFNNTQNSSHTIPVEIVKLGFEWILETAVFRFEYFSTKQTFFGSEDAQTITSEDLGVLNSDNNRPQTETIKLQGGLGLVVQGRF